MNLYEPNTPARLLKALLLAVIGAVIIGGIVSAQSPKPKGPTAESIIVDEPTICILLTPGGYWWDWWKCDDWKNKPADAKATATKGGK
jgi:hypothetical protein